MGIGPTDHPKGSGAGCVDKYFWFQVYLKKQRFTGNHC